MTITRTATVVQAAATVAVSPAALISAWMPITGNETSLVIKITNGVAGPTLGCTASVDLSTDALGTTVYPDAGGPPFLAGVANNGVYAAQFDLLNSTMYYRTRFGGNTGNAVTAQAEAMTVSGTP